MPFSAGSASAMSDPFDPELFLAPYGEVPPITSEMMSADRVTEAAVAFALPNSFLVADAESVTPET
jgi:hypothetical protein